MTEWYYRDSQSRKIGPLSTEEFEERVDAGEVKPHTKVWRSGLIDWTTYAALCAHDEQGAKEESGPSTNAAPQSSSYQTQIALGASATNRNTGGTRKTPAATPPMMAAPNFESCPECRQQVPSNLFREMGRRRVCGFCMEKIKAKAKRDQLRDAKGADANWLGKHLIRVAIGAAVLITIRLIGIELKAPKTGTFGHLPTTEEHSPLPVPRSLVSGAAGSRPTALAPDIDLIPQAGQ